ncbi:MAG TPA: Holliday junction branch migration protein RuvA [Alphaproteobacteria bacterium]|nr:Holliday junction branch migration protein RuvA [Alphaproteobacteria bacterium]
MDETSVIIDVGGVGYAVTVSGKTRAGLGLADPAVTLLTDMQVREDSMTLFGFTAIQERDAFRLLVTVQGVGAKAAMAILSVLTPDELADAVMSGDRAMVARADGVGPKLAQRVVNELATKIGSLPVAATGMGESGGAAGGNGTVGVDAMSALVNLGYGRAEAHAALQRVRAGGASGDDLSALIAAALQELGQ